MPVEASIGLLRDVNDVAQGKLRMKDSVMVLRRAGFSSEGTYIYRAAAIAGRYSESC